MTRLIPLTKGHFATVDDADYDWLSQWKWYAQTNGRGNNYAARVEHGKRVLMHRLVNATPDGLMTDHVDGNGLNNTRENLRSATALQNMMNRRGNATSKVKGAWFAKDQRGSRKWRAAIKLNGRTHYLGYFETASQAGTAYTEAARKYFGEFANSTVREQS